MGLLQICPHCRAKMPLDHIVCPFCAGDLKNLPAKDRRYCLSPEMAAVPEREETPLAVEVPENLSFGGPFPETADVSLCEALDRILHKGAVLFGEVTLAVADIDLVYLGLQVILASMETARGFIPGAGTGRLPFDVSKQGDMQ